MKLSDIDLNTGPSWRTYAIIAVVLIVAGVVAWNHFHPAQPVTPMSQKQAETKDGVQEAAENAGIKLPTGQATETADEIAAAATRPPDKVVPTTGAGMQQALDSTRQDNKADFQIVTDPVHPDTAPAQPKPDQAVNLNVYNVQAYPQHLIEATAYTDGGDVAYLTRIKVFGHVGYVGPALSYVDSKVRVGVRISVPF